MLHILIRTCYRPNAFRRALASIDVPATVHVCYDDIRAKGYVPANSVWVGGKYPQENFWYNLYCNDLLAMVEKPGHIIFLDDDDEIIPGALGRLSPKLEPDVSYIAPFMRGTFQKPTTLQIHMKSLRAGYCGLPNMILWSGHREHVQFDSTELADYKALQALNSAVPVQWINIPVVQAHARGRGIKEIIS